MKILSVIVTSKAAILTFNCTKKTSKTNEFELHRVKRGESLDLKLEKTWFA